MIAGRSHSTVLDRCSTVVAQLLARSKSSSVQDTMNAKDRILLCKERAGSMLEDGSAETTQQHLPLVVDFGPLPAVDTQGFPERDVAMPDIIYDFLDNALAQKPLGVRHGCDLERIESHEGVDGFNPERRCRYWCSSRPLRICAVLWKEHRIFGVELVTAIRLCEVAIRFVDSVIVWIAG